MNYFCEGKGSCTGIDCPHRGRHTHTKGCDENHMLYRGYKTDCPQSCIPEFVRVTMSAKNPQVWFNDRVGQIYKVLGTENGCYSVEPHGDEMERVIWIRPRYCEPFEGLPATPTHIRVTKCHPDGDMWYNYHIGETYRVQGHNYDLDQPGYRVAGPDGPGYWDIRISDCEPCKPPAPPKHIHINFRCADVLPIEYKQIKPVSLKLLWEAAGDRTGGMNFLAEWALFMNIISRMHGPALSDLWGKKTFEPIIRKLSSDGHGKWALALLVGQGFIAKEFEPFVISIDYTIENGQADREARMYGDGTLGTTGMNVVTARLRSLFRDAMEDAK